MTLRRAPRFSSRARHRVARALGCLALSVLVVGGAFALWPPSPPRPPAPLVREVSREALATEAAVPTRQGPAAPRPAEASAPAVPAAPPAEAAPAEAPAEMSGTPEASASPALGAGDETPGLGGGGPARGAEAGPLAGSLAPAYPDDAAHAGLWARAVVEVTVGEAGEPLDAAIVARFVRAWGGPEEAADVLPFEMDAAALAAALGHAFAPAAAGVGPSVVRIEVTFAPD